MTKRTVWALLIVLLLTAGAGVALALSPERTLTAVQNIAGDASLSYPSPYPEPPQDNETAAEWAKARRAEGSFPVLPEPVYASYPAPGGYPQP